MRAEQKPFLESFSVLMSVYQKDDPALLRRALDSLVCQSVLSQKILIVSDGPLTQELELVLKNFVMRHSELVKILRLKQNCGLATALNFGLKHIETEWVARADADDINHVDRFRETANVLAQNPEVSLVGSAINECNVNGEVLQVKSQPCDHLNIISYCRKRNPFNHMTVVYRVRAALAVGGYPNINLREDYGLWIKLLSSGVKSMNIQKTLVNATADNDFYVRRGGIRYALGEITLQKLLVAHKMKSAWQAFFHGVMRAAIFVGPVAIRRAIYRSILR